MKEAFIEKMLGVKTEGDQIGFHNHFHYHPYEPTPYFALDKLFADYKLSSSDEVVDFGSGKGRLNFYLNYLFNSFVVGIEHNPAFYYEAIKNRNSYLRNFKNRGDRIRFENCLAEEYEISSRENKFYFFNPFSVQIFMKVMKNILISAEKNAREIEIILYYPSQDYIHYLDTRTPFRKIKEISLLEKNIDERFLIYRLYYF